MSISFPSTGEITGADTPTSIPYSNTNLLILAANPTRAAGGLVINNGTKVLWLNVTGAFATTAHPSIPVPANGGAYDLPGNYKGNVYGIWVAGGSGSAAVHEFNAG
jgi:hypothetical protein